MSVVKVVNNSYGTKPGKNLEFLLSNGMFFKNRRVALVEQIIVHLA